MNANNFSRPSCQKMWYFYLNWQGLRDIWTEFAEFPQHMAAAALPGKKKLTHDSINLLARVGLNAVAVPHINPHRNIYSIAVDTIMEVNLTLYIIQILSVSSRRSLCDAISSTVLLQLSADRPLSCCLLASRLADQIWTFPLSVRPATFACSL